MRNSIRSVSLLVAAVVLCGGWAGFAQVQDKAKDKPATPAKKPPEAAKPAGEAGKKPAEASKPQPAAAKDAKKPVAAEQPAATDETADQAAIRKGAAAFVTAYKAHDAKAVSELFALKAEFTDEDGNLVKGREAIEKDFVQMFEQNPQCSIAVEIDSIRLLTPNIAVEEGIVRGQPAPDVAENVSSYIAVHVKVEGRWVIGSVKDFEAPSAALTANDHLQELAWMVGDWIEESPDSVVKSSCRWDASGNYLLHEFVVHVPGGAFASGSLRIGWDSLTGQIKSWTFGADGGYSEGLWVREGDEWSVKLHGANGAGKVTSATNVFRYINKDTMAWRSYDRIVGGQPVDDVPEYIVKRQAPPPEQ